LACESGDCVHKTLAQIQLVVGWIAAAALVAAGVLQLWASRPIAIRGFIVAAVLVLGWAVLAEAVAG
jgi:hypothetical protein